ncbi:MAG: DEAD/DEAH box helicase, partial [Parachlamydiaceae bacterium]
MKDILNESLQIEAVQNGVAALIEAYVSFHNQPKIKEEIEKMLNLIFEKMHKEYLVTFDERLTILSNFLQALSPFLKKLDSLVEKRFFKSDGTIKNHVLNHLIVEAVKLKCTFLEETELGDATLQENVPKEKKLIEDLSKVTAFVCHSEIEKVIQPCSLPGLVSATSQFESVVCRRIDQLSYTDEEFIQAFCNHANNQAQRQAENDLPDILANLTQNKEQIFADYREFLQQRTIPINFILPNQALAVQLCRCPQLDNRHLLIKLGTGQGKSLVIALAAIHEAKKIQKSGEFVLVLTSYDHLAKRDHEFGSHFFRKDNIESICISEINHVTTSFHPNVKIIYADIETLDDIIRKIMLKLLENREGNKPTSQEKEFIKAIYDAGKRLSVILDEYDLLLCDYEEKTPFCDVVGTSFLPV